MQVSLRMWTAALAVAVLTAAATPDPPIDAGKSSVSVAFKQMNVPVEAPFRKFAGTVHYDPAKPDAGKAHIEIDMSSLDVGDEEYNAEVRKKEWFDSAKYPTAVFEASSLRPLGNNRFQAIGELLLKGRTQSLTVPVTLNAAGGVDVFEGSVAISRAKFDIGDAQWKDTVADEVTVKFRIAASPAS